MVSEEIRDLYKVILKKKLNPRLWPEQWEDFNSAFNSMYTVNELRQMPPLKKPGSVELCRKYAIL